MFVLDEEVLIG